MASKFDELTERYMEAQGENLTQEEWELAEKLSSKYNKASKKEAIKVFETLFCSIEELEEMEE